MVKEEPIYAFKEARQSGDVSSLIFLDSNTAVEPMFYYRGFLFLIMDENTSAISFIPLSEQNKTKMKKAHNVIRWKDKDGFYHSELDKMLKGHENDYVSNDFLIYSGVDQNELS